MTEHTVNSANFAEDRKKASDDGKKGRQNSGGSFKNDPEKASEAGKKGGKSLSPWLITKRQRVAFQCASLGPVTPSYQ
jgi:general stress protein YciG